MYLMFLDESGVSNLKNDKTRPQSDFFLIGGFIIKEENYYECMKKFKDFKRKNLPELLRNDPLHATELNNINRCKNEKLKINLTVEEGQRILTDSYNFINNLKIESIAIIIDNVGLKNKYKKPENPYHIAYAFIIEKFQKIISGRNDLNNSIGLVNLSSCSGKLTKNLKEIHDYIKNNGTMYVKNFDNILSNLNIEPSKNSCCYEIADLICFAHQRHYYGWLCENITDLKPVNQYIHLIPDISTLNIGNVILENKFRIKVFPGLRDLKKN